MTDKWLKVDGTISDGEFDHLTDDELGNLMVALNHEFERRVRAKHEKLISDFKDAFNALREANIYINYYEDDYDDNCTAITDWDNFDFV